MVWSAVGGWFKSRLTVGCTLSSEGKERKGIEEGIEEERRDRVCLVEPEITRNSNWEVTDRPYTPVWVVA